LKKPVAQRHIQKSVRRSALLAATPSLSYRAVSQLVSVCVAGLLVGHRTSVALAAASGFVVLAFATSMGVLALFLLFAAGHGCVFATAFSVAASRRVLVIVLRV